MLAFGCGDSGDSGNDKEQTGTTNKPGDIVSVQNRTVSGVSQKGPFVTGSTVTVQELNGESLLQTGISFKGKISNDKGEFKVASINLASQYAFLEVNGYYRNEVTGSNSTSPIIMNALADISDRENVNINLLTHLETDRVMHLVTVDGKSFGEAKNQARKELLGYFGIDGNFGASEDMSIFGQNEDSAALLAISIIVQGDLRESQFTERLARIAGDIADGTIDNTEIWQQMATGALMQNLQKIRQNVESWGESVPDYEKYVKAFWRSKLGLGSCSNIGETQIYQDVELICTGNGWEVKVCVDGEMKCVDENISMVCQDGKWGGAKSCAEEAQVCDLTVGECMDLAPKCDNGICDPGEEEYCPQDCNDGDLCGNGTLDDGEACDDGNDKDGDGCAADCHKIEDGFECPEPGNACKMNDGDLCGNGVCDPGEEEYCPQDCNGEDTCNNPCENGQSCINGRCLGDTFCSGFTYNTAYSLDACGECGNRCPDGKTCLNGECVTGNGMAYCGEETYFIGNLDRCADCNDKCADGQICQNNQCVEGKGEVYCNGKITNTELDVSNCGACGHQCDNGKICRNGQCASGQGEMYCNGILVDTTNDTANCKGCGNKCAAGYFCSGGSCQSYKLNSTAELIYNGETVHPYSDSNHCGTGFEDCGTGKYCSEGKCTRKAPQVTTQTYCNGSLSHIYIDSLNCGGCNIVCPNGNICVNGACTSASLTQETEHECGGALSYPYHDSFNCGGCGIECSDSQYCDQGTCKSRANLKVGDYFIFGHYEQDNDLTNGKEPISWKILDKKDDKYLVISEKALDVKPFNESENASGESADSIPWEMSTIRSWLNGYGPSFNNDKRNYISDNFINTAFTASERSKIIQSTVPAHVNPNFPNTNAGNDTEDKIFLLSVTEIEQYFDNKPEIPEGKEEDYPNNCSKVYDECTLPSRRVDSTPYVIKNKSGYVYFVGSESFNGDQYTEKKCSDIHCYPFWWLRTPGMPYDRQAFVTASGSFRHDAGYGVVGMCSITVRPAMWVKL